MKSRVPCSYWYTVVMFLLFYLRHHLFKISRLPLNNKKFPQAPLFAVAKISGPPIFISLIRMRSKRDIKMVGCVRRGVQSSELSVGV